MINHIECRSSPKLRFIKLIAAISQCFKKCVFSIVELNFLNSVFFFIPPYNLFCVARILIQGDSLDFITLQITADLFTQELVAVFVHVLTYLKTIFSSLSLTPEDKAIDCLV